MSGALLTIVLLASVVGGLGGRGVEEARVGSPFEAVGAPVSGHSPIALTGPRGIALAATPNEVRPRTGPFVEPAALGLAGGSPGAGAGLTAAEPRPPHLAARGFLTVRAPPA